MRYRNTLQAQRSAITAQLCGAGLALWGFPSGISGKEPTPALLPGESHGQRSPAGCSPWGHKDSDMTGAT